MGPLRQYQTVTIVKNRFRQFKSGDCEVAAKLVEDEKSQALLDEDPTTKFQQKSKEKHAKLIL